MDTWERLKIGTATTGVVILLLGIRWVTDRVYPETYLAEPAYKVPGVVEPTVDLGALQRSWPAGLGEAGGRANLRDFMGNIQNVVVPKGPEEPPPSAAPAPPVDLGTLLAQADPKKGQQTAQVCTSCHSFEQGQDRVGPSLWGVVGRNVASRTTFQYSSAFAAQTGSWTYERLDHYLTNPAKAIPGNKMGFAGLRRPEDRANVLAFLRTLSASPVPFPKPDATKVASAEGAAPAAE
jgi:cytochrome c